MRFRLPSNRSYRRSLSSAAFSARQRGGFAIQELLECRRLLSVSYTTTEYAEFNGANGTNPNGPMIYEAGNLFGVTSQGGDDGGIGTIFEIPASTGQITTLINSGDVSGATPVGGLISGSTGGFFGVAQGGGDPGNGSVFAVSSSGGYNTLAAFTGEGIENQTNPAGPLVDVNGDLFGVAVTGGVNDTGEIFEVADNSGVITDLAPFSPTSHAMAGLVTDSTGNIYGMYSPTGGSSGGVFELSGGSLTTLASFSSTNNGYAGGYLEEAPLLDSNGNIFGVNTGGVFEIAAGTNTVDQLGTSSGLSGPPDSPLIMDSSGDLFGTTTTGAFEWSSSTHSFTMIATLPTSANGIPDGMVFGTDGDIFVTDGGGGTAGDGAIYELIPNGTVTPTTGTLTPTISKSTVPTAIVSGAKLHGSLKVLLDNTAGTNQKGFTVKVYASTDTTLATSADTLVTTITKPATIKAGKSARLTVPIKMLPASLNGSYYMIVEAVDSAGNPASVASNSQSTVAAPFVSLSETVTGNLPSTPSGGSTTNGKVTLEITNHGNVASKGSTAIDVTASAVSGMPGTSIATLSKKLNIQPGKSAKVVVPVKSIPSLAVGNYFLVAQVTDPFAGGTSIGSSSDEVLTITA